MEPNKIGNYIHYEFDNYLKYGISEDDPSRAMSIEQVNAVFEQQTRSIKRKLKRQYETKQYDLEKIENVLNFYFSLQNGDKDSLLQRNLSEEHLQALHESIIQHIGKKAQGADINRRLIQSSMDKGGLSNEVLDSILAEQTRTTREVINRFLDSNFAKGKTATTTSIETRINFLLKLRDSLSSTTNANEIISKINELESTWTSLKHDMQQNNEKKVVLSEGSTASFFVNDLNELIASFKQGSTTVHGDYAEAIVALASYLATVGASTTIADFQNDIADILKKSVVANKKSQSTLLQSNFDTRYVHIETVAPESRWVKKDEQGNVFTAHATQDKVDVVLTIDDMNIPVSVKNYNLGMFSNPDLHFLSGTSVLILTQDYASLMNHYLNVGSAHPDKEAPNATLSKAKQAVKLIILLKALEGGVQKRNTETGTISPGDKAELIIINDNSQGRFRVFTLSTILGMIQDRIDDLVKTGDFDKVNLLNNDYQGDKGVPNDLHAQLRISHMLNQLHTMQLSVSIDKDVFRSSFSEKN